MEENLQTRDAANKETTIIRTYKTKKIKNKSIINNKMAYIR